MKYKIISFILITFFIFGLLMNLHINNDSTLGNIKDKIIRLHVVANSDSPEDQSIKLHIRDAIIKELEPKLQDLKTQEEVKSIILANMDNLMAAAKEEMATLGKNFPIQIEFGTFEFPTKVYGDLSFPAGTYQALNVKIGEAQGKNWWCVMFPPLCFVDIAQGVVSEKTLEEFKEILDENELELLKSKKDDEKETVKIKFKLVEMAKDFNKNLAKIIGKE
ncbi:stage II sporulation protein R [Lutispora thermophila]|uniref:Stage II sporulation protein R n=1 Tax=Lutispora thermophila DSM 19022 TaxID=1122184 RepID=A0A1M6BU82_9FIRM|nr:stage II sporulation protein R [Lutispora thermophila]SHI52247.1 stage II sporulation protein R [Lutispora thermophila DSM 19022]